MAVTINASTSAGLVQTADTTGNLSLQSNGTTIAALTSTGLAVTGAGSFSTTLGVTGTSTLAAVNASGLVAMAGAATVGTTLGVTGAATLSSTLGVTGTIQQGSGSGATAGVIIGNLQSGLAGIWSTGVTPSSSNHSVLVGVTESAIRGTTSAAMRVGSVNIVEASSTGATITGTLGVTGVTTTTGNLLLQGGMTTTAANTVIDLDAFNSSTTKIKMGSDLYGSDTGINIGMFGGGAMGIMAGAGLRLYCGTTRTGASGGIDINTAGNTNVTGALSKASGSFRIPHPLPALNETHNLVHSFIEGPQADLIYRGRVSLVVGKATINIDTAATMTEGTFELLCGDVQCFTSNETDWNHVRGSVVGNILTIECQDMASVATISWMVIGERKDQHMLDTEWTDDNGKVIVEPLKPIPLAVVEEPQHSN